MTNTALKKLSKDKDGFFLMVEGSQIDWAGHDNDIVGAMSEMEDFEQAYKAAIDFAKKTSIHWLSQRLTTQPAGTPSVRTAFTTGSVSQLKRQNARLTLWQKKSPAAQMLKKH